MEIGIYGLGRMGMGMARRLLARGHRVAACNRTRAKTDELAALGAEPAYSLEELAAALAPPRTVWLMLPHRVVGQNLEELAERLEEGDLAIDGGNSPYQEDAPRAEMLARRGVLYMDVGVSGGVWGEKEGFCLMSGGPEEAFRRVEPVLADLAPPGGYLHCGPVGSGHFVKMIHNGIEYGMMQALAEGFHLLHSGPYGRDLDLRAVAGLWQEGSVVRSWLLELLERALAEDGRLEGLAAYVEDSGEGRWSVQQAVDTATPAPVITLALMERFRSRQDNSFADRVLAALRNQFGGHAVKESGS
jgi:6-phosphogluconate dehydrogenase